MVENIQQHKVYCCSVTSNFVYPDGTYLSYKGMNHFYYEEADAGAYRIVIRNRTSEVRNPRNSVADDPIIQLGNCLFPVSFLLDETGEVKMVENFDEVWARRTAKSEELAKQYPTIEFKKYLDISMMNFRDEASLRKKLMSDTFVQVIIPLLHGNPNFMLHFDNFPKKMSRTSYQLKKEEEEADHVIYKVDSLFPSLDGGYEKGEAEMFAKDGFFNGFKGVFSVVDKDGLKTQRGLIFQMEE